MDASSPVIAHSVTGHMKKVAGYFVVTEGENKMPLVSRTIAFIDENKELVDIMVEFFSKSGYQAVGLSGPDFVKQLDDLRPSLILIDPRMRSSNGEIVFQAILDEKNLQGVPIIIMTSFINSIDSSIISRTRGILEKPFSLNILLDYVNHCLDEC